MEQWNPQPKQKQALKRKNDQEILYGGARGGGKTDAGMAWLLYDIDKPKFRALVIRRNEKDLRDWIDRAKRMYAAAGGKFKGVPPECSFPSGAKIRIGHLNDADAYTQFQGHEYQRILIEELTHIPREQDYEKLLGSCRSTVDELKPQVFATTNPDGPGYQWVKERFKIPNRPTENIETKIGKRSRVFIPARVEDNPILVKKDPGYVEYLESIADEELRKAWRDGDWSGMSLEGAVYVEMLNNSRKEGRITSVPYDHSLPVHTYWDIGLSDATAIGFFQKVKNQWNMIDYHEDRGKVFSHYVKVIKEKGYVYGTHFGPHDLARSDYKSGENVLNFAANLGIDFNVLTRGEINDGITAVKMRFNQIWFDQHKCEKFLQAIAHYRRKWNEDKADWDPKPVHDWASHAADVLRYWAVAPDPYEGQIKLKY